MKFQPKNAILAFLILFTCGGTGSLYAMHRKTAGEKLDESIDKTEETAKKAKEKVKNTEQNAKEKAAEVAENAKERADTIHQDAKRKAHKGIDKL